MNASSDECTRALPQSGYRLTAPSRRELLHIDGAGLYCNFFDTLSGLLGRFSHARKGGNRMNTCFIKWLKAAGVRAVKTVAQTAVATIGTSAILSEVNWLMVGSASLLAGVLSMLTSVAGLPECKETAEPESEL